MTANLIPNIKAFYWNSALKLGKKSPEWQIIKDSNLFDVDYYLKQNSDLAQSNVDPLIHYLISGASEERNPHPLFDSSYYLKQNPDVAQAQLNPLIHFIEFGIERNVQSVISSISQIDLLFLSSYKVKLEQNIISDDFLTHKLGEIIQCIEQIEPIIAEINHIYSRFLFREPSSREILDHLISFYKDNETFESRAQIIKQGNFGKYLGIRPFKLKIDTVNQCNLRCIMCHFSNPEVSRQKKTEISPENFSKIAAEIFPFCSQVFLSFSTEPLIHSQLDKILTITADYQIPSVSMTTNGLLLNERIIDSIINSNITNLYISIDGASKETYEKIRIGGKFDRLISNIKSLNLAKEKIGSKIPHLAFNFTMMYSNILDLPDLIRLAHELKVETVAATHLVPLEIASVEQQKESLHFHKNLSNRILKEAQDLAEKYQIKINFPEPFTEFSESIISEQTPRIHRSLQSLPLDQEKPQKSCCFFPWHFIGIDPQGDIVPCGWWYNQETMGNILQDSFETIWNNNKYQSLRAEHVSGDLRSICKICPTMGMGNVNSSNSFIER